MFKNFHNSLNSLEYQYSVHNSLFYTYILTFKTRLHHRTLLKIDNKRTFQRTLFRNERAEQLCRTVSIRIPTISWKSHLRSKFGYSARDTQYVYENKHMPVR